MVKRRVGPILTLGWLLLFSNQLWAHPSDHWVEPSRALALWADAVNSQNRELVAELTASTAMPFISLPGNLATIHYATYKKVGDTVEASPVVITFSASNVSAWKTTLVHESGHWRIQGLSPVELPTSLRPSGLAEQNHTKAVRFRVRSGGKPAYARVSITETDGASDYWPPRGHQKNIREGWRQDVGGGRSHRWQNLCICCS